MLVRCDPKRVFGLPTVGGSRLSGLCSKMKRPGTKFLLQKLRNWLHFVKIKDLFGI